MPLDFDKRKRITRNLQRGGRLVWPAVLLRMVVTMWALRLWFDTCGQWRRNYLFREAKMYSKVMDD